MVKIVVKINKVLLKICFYWIFIPAVKLDLKQCGNFISESCRYSQDTHHLQLPLKLMGIAGIQHHWGFVSRRGIYDLSRVHWSQPESTTKTYPWKELKFSVLPSEYMYTYGLLYMRRLMNPSHASEKLVSCYTQCTPIRENSPDSSILNSGHTLGDHCFDRSKHSWRHAGACG